MSWGQFELAQLLDSVPLDLAKNNPANTSPKLQSFGEEKSVRLGKPARIGDKAARWDSQPAHVGIGQLTPLNAPPKCIRGDHADAPLLFAEPMLEQTPDGS